MFLVIDPTTQFYVFTEKDPREDGFEGLVQSDICLDESGTLSGRSLDSTTAVPCLGRSSTNAKHYSVFQCMKDCRAAGFEAVALVYGKYESWREFQADN